MYNKCGMQRSMQHTMQHTMQHAMQYAMLCAMQHALQHAMQHAMQCGMQCIMQPAMQQAFIRLPYIIWKNFASKLMVPYGLKHHKSVGLHLCCIGFIYFPHLAFSR